MDARHERDHSHLSVKSHVLQLFEMLNEADDQSEDEAEEKEGQPAAHND